MSAITKKIGWLSGAALVVANMIGTGVFTSLGFQLVDINNTISIIILWFLGGVIALAGAFCYADLGSYFQESGGEYKFLTKSFHPLIGYLSGWISLTVGFAAPVALATMALGEYVAPSLGIQSKILGIIVLVSLGVIHSLSIKKSSLFQNLFTLLKLLLIFGLIGVGLFAIPELNALDFTGAWKQEIFLPTFAIALVYVSYSYTGWNAAAYIVSEIKNPTKNLPKALIRGTVLVSVLYIVLQVIFLAHSPLWELQGKLDVGQVFAKAVFGPEGASLVNYAIGLLLISSISAMTWIGPRVSMAMANDHAFWKFLRKKEDVEIPIKATWLQVFLAILLLLSGSFEQILLYCGFILQLSSAMTVIASLKLRLSKNAKLQYKSPFFPVFHVVFLAISLWILLFLITQKPIESAIGLGNLLVGIITYYISLKLSKNETNIIS